MKAAKELLKTKSIITEKKIGVGGTGFDKSKKCELFSILLDSSKKICSEEGLEYRKNKEVISMYLKELGLNYKSFSSSFDAGLGKMFKACERSGTDFDVNTIGSMFLLYARSVLKKWINEKKKNNKVKKNVILHQIKMPHLFESDIFTSLSKEYKKDPIIKDWMINKAILDNATNPALKLESAKEKIKELREFYKNDSFVEDRMINQTAFSGQKPGEGILDAAKNKIDNAKIQYKKLLNKYKDDDFVEKGDIKRFIFEYKDFEQALESAKSKYEELLNKYKEDDFLEKADIKYFVIHNPKNPEGALLSYKKQCIILLAQFKDDSIIENFMIKTVVKNNPNAANSIHKKTLNNAKIEYKRLLDKYKDDDFVDGLVIKRLIIKQIFPEQVLINAKIEYKKLLNKYKEYPHLEDGMMKYFVIDNPTDPEGALLAYLKLKE